MMPMQLYHPDITLLVELVFQIQIIVKLWHHQMVLVLNVTSLQVWDYIISYPMELVSSVMSMDVLNIPQLVNVYLVKMDSE